MSPTPIEIQRWIDTRRRRRDGAQDQKWFREIRRLPEWRLLACYAHVESLRRRAVMIPATRTDLALFRAALDRADRRLLRDPT